MNLVTLPQQPTLGVSRSHGVGQLVQLTHMEQIGWKCFFKYHSMSHTYLHFNLEIFNFSAL